MPGYRDDLAHVHDAGFTTLAEAGAEVLLEELAGRGVESGTIVDLGCGSGVSAARLTDAGFDLIGYDSSAAMIELASRRAPTAQLHVGSYLDVQLPRGLVAVLAVGEVFNYAFDGAAGIDSLPAVFASIAEALRPGGVLLFDSAGPGRGDGGTRGWSEGEGWAVLYEAREDVAAATLTRSIVTFRDCGDGFRRDQESHVLRLYPPLELLRLLRGVGLKARSRDGYGREPLGPGWRVFAAERPR